VQSLRDKFEELRHRIGHGRTLDSTGTEPIFYLVFPVVEIVDVKRQAKAWIAKLDNDGWNVVLLSMADAVQSALRGNKLRKFWLESERQLLNQARQSRQPLDFREINKTLSAALVEGSELQEIIESKLRAAESQRNGLLLIADLEALHPYLRINTIESKLQGRVHCPVVVLYPGKREGKTSLRFLEFYPADPNYRSEHIG
jgi:bacteriophage exclusion system BrxB-like protein